MIRWLQRSGLFALKGLFAQPEYCDRLWEAPPFFWPYHWGIQVGVSEQEFLFPALPGTISNLPSHWKITFPFPKSGNAISNIPFHSREKKFSAGN